MIAAVIRFVAVLLQVGLSAARRFKVQFWNHLVITFVALAGSYFLVPSAGLLGAALVVLLTAVCHLCSVATLNYTAIRSLAVSQPAPSSV